MKGFSGDMSGKQTANCPEIDPLYICSAIETTRKKDFSHGSKFSAKWCPEQIQV